MKTKQLGRKKRIMISVHLNASDIAFLKRLVKSGTRKAREITRARILLMSHAKKTNREIMEALGCSPFMISSLRTRWLKRKKDIQATLVDAPRPGQPKKVLPAHEAFVVATACTDAPTGHAHWTLQSLRDKLLETYKEMNTLSHERIRQILLKNKLKPWREKNVVRSKAHTHLSRADG